ncbi:MAG: hypothetical protein FP821_02280 [Sideroxydans sp.]|nr:hypothetical protein [Sideroxydans sp.]
MDVIKVALDGLQERVATYGKEAETLCNRHFEFVMAMNKRKGWDSKSKLYALTRVRGYGLTVNWYEVSWYGSKAQNNRRSVKKLITKPAKSYGYNFATLLKYAQPWEVDLVKEIETELAEIRRKVSVYSKALLHLKQVERLETE